MADSIGAIWKKMGKSGKAYLSVQLNGTWYTAFENDKGDNPKRPDWKIFPQLPRNNDEPAF